jgi:hypothetical protein
MRVALTVVGGFGVLAAAVANAKLDPSTVTPVMTAITVRRGDETNGMTPPQMGSLIATLPGFANAPHGVVPRSPRCDSLSRGRDRTPQPVYRGA